MEIMGIDKNRCSLGVTEHPFTTGFSKYDVRITTKYLEDNFLSSIYSVVHEGGHALYEMNVDDEYSYTCLEGGVSMGVHESQSRFYENIIGRSKEYIELIYPELVKFCPELSKYSADEIYRLANKAMPSLIRTEADELTYSLHIMVRYEMERAFTNGTVPTKELPEMWNSLYKEYLGIDVPNDREGILQDSHWSGGSIGYFPSYALGSAYGTQLLSRMKETVNVEDCVRNGNFAPINGWLKDRIWKYGSLYKPTQVMEKAMGAPFDPKYFVDYLKAKMADVYGF
jgi:carboxypeptidase Taq